MTAHELEAVAQRLSILIADRRAPEPWLDKRGLAAHLACSVRSVEGAMAEGLPYAVIFGRAKFRASEAETWLERLGHLRPQGGVRRVVVGSNDDCGAAPLARPAPDTRRIGSDALQA
jgi:hypothetical protein